MKFLRISLLIAVFCTTGLGVANARTWYVELDGSGDFDDIQPAVDASAAGDTIRIGPGRFDTFHSCVAPAWTEDAIVSVTRNNLTFIGSGKRVTILGTSAYYGTPTTDPRVFCSIDSYGGAIEDMTIENVELGIYWYGGSVRVKRCLFRGEEINYFGLLLTVDEGMVLDCEFETDGNGSACLLNRISREFSVQDCQFRGSGFAVRVANGSQNILVSGCDFDDAYSGIWYAGHTTGSIENCDLRSCFYRGIQVSDSSNAIIDQVSIDGGEVGISVSGSSVLTGNRIVIENTTEAGMLVFSQARVTMHGSHILPASGLGVRCFGYVSSHAVLDMTDNYWGTTDSDSIAAMIEDEVDDPSVLCTVDYVPFANGPVPTERTSWGSVKSMFRE